MHFDIMDLVIVEASAVARPDGPSLLDVLGEPLYNECVRHAARRILQGTFSVHDDTGVPVEPIIDGQINPRMCISIHVRHEIQKMHSAIPSEIAV